MAVGSISNQQVAFRGNNGSKKPYHTGAAVASFVLPGTGAGQFIKGDIGRGFAHLGITAGLTVVALKVLKSMEKSTNLKIKLMALGAAGLGFVANAISSVLNAHKPSPEEK
jgi:hypothetical protein